MAQLRAWTEGVTVVKHAQEEAGQSLNKLKVEIMLCKLRERGLS